MFSYVSYYVRCLLCLLCSSVFVSICGFVMRMLCLFRFVFILLHVCTYYVLNDLLCVCFVMFLFSHAYVMYNYVFVFLVWYGFY